MTGALNAWVGGRWVPVDLKGPPGNMGSVGAAGAFTWPASNYRNFTNNRSSGDGITEPGPLSTANSGSNPCCKVNATNTSRVEVLTTGIMICACLFQCSNVMINGGCYVNIRRQPADTVLASFVPVQGETDIVATAIFPVTVGDILSFPFNKVSGGTHSIATTIRTGLLV